MARLESIASPASVREQLLLPAAGLEVVQREVRSVIEVLAALEEVPQASSAMPQLKETICGELPGPLRLLLLLHWQIFLSTPTHDPCFGQTPRG